MVHSFFCGSFMLRQGKYFFTSESVSRGHPDKLCDQISDLIVDAYLSDDPFARTAIETVATTNRVIVLGEVRGNPNVAKTLEEKIRQCVQEIGYEQDGFHYNQFVFQNYIHAQSADIARGVDATLNKDEGAGDQGIMFGFACAETETLMPAPIYWAHRLLKNLDYLRKNDAQGRLRPDAKSQVTLIYEDGVPVGVKTIVLSTQHRDDLSNADVCDYVAPMIYATLPPEWMTAEIELFINPTGRFVIGGPDGDTGLTGRKIIVDTYGGVAPHGGGAFSGKDPTKVDRSAAYMARYLAKNIVASGLASRCLLQVSYGIGIARPLSLYVDFQGTGNVPEQYVEQAIMKNLPLTLAGIKQHLGLNAPIYLPTASFGHFGRLPTDAGLFSWEKCDLVDFFKTC